MEDPDRFQCARCGREDAPRLERSPMRSDVGDRVRREVCSECWEDWKERQMLLINHFGLNVREPDAREFLLENLGAFLFGEGEGAEIDVSREGQVDW